MKHLLVLWIALLSILLLDCGGAAPIRGSQSSAATAPGTQETTASSTERPGLGTEFGETRQSPTKSGQFARNSSQPFGVASLWYNDPEGARAMASSAGYRQEDRAVVPVLEGMITMYLEGENGKVLPGFVTEARHYVIGQAGQRYIIKFQNHTGYRFLVVASVDGLDVLDGRTAAVSKPGYILEPNTTLAIDGFRTSASSVAAFRFSSVKGSYSAKSGQGDRNVGVIGAAFFNEKGVTPKWGPEEVNRRNSAEPFPSGGYSQPPGR